MKGTIISFILGFVVFGSLNHKILEPFFKIKRQRIYKGSNFEPTSSKINKVSNANSFKKRLLKQIKTKPPVK
ncbi:MAG: hypothetical protein H7263_12415 [Candidatus Sericytochromatia bacterium]|nr:hypothetical protein [Candidatus Sericytochromatia bacterium]